jgi:hypothetical protein
MKLEILRKEIIFCLSKTSNIRTERTSVVVVVVVVNSDQFVAVMVMMIYLISYSPNVLYSSPSFSFCFGHCVWSFKQCLLLTTFPFLFIVRNIFYILEAQAVKVCMIFFVFITSNKRFL